MDSASPVHKHRLRIKENSKNFKLTELEKHQRGINEPKSSNDAYDFKKTGKKDYFWQFQL